MMRGGGSGLRAFLLALVGLLLGLAAANPALARTIVKKTGECEVTITLKLEIWGPSASEDVAKKMKEQIENTWNAPSYELVEQIAGQMGVSQADLEKAASGDDEALRKKIDDAAKKALEDAGADTSCFNVNCCKVFFKVDIKVRQESDEPSKDYHQIKIVPRWENQVQPDGSTKKVKNRSYVMGLKGQEASTTGQWAYDPNDPLPPHGHECGHLMGLEDEYDDATGSHEGHEHDIMNWNRGWPQEDGIKDILKTAGIECDCCPKDAATVAEGLFVRYGATFRTAGDAILTKHCDVLKQLEQDYMAQLGNAKAANIPASAKAELISKINEMLGKVRKALEDCPKETATTTGVIGEGVPFTYDSRVCVNYGGGTTSIPIGPGGIGIPTGPVSGPAGAPPQAPASTPGETPGATPQDTPGTPPGTAPPTGPVTPLNPGDIGPGQIPPIPADFFGPGSDPFLPPSSSVTIETAAGRTVDTTVTRLNPDGTPETPEGTPTIPIEIVELGLTSITPVTVTTPEQEEEEVPEVVAPPVMIVKAEQSVLEGDKTVTKPVQGAVLKLGYPPPQLPGTTQRTAEATDDQHDAEPRHVVTNSDGVGMIFADGFESGDTSAWTVGEKPKPRPSIMPSPGQTTLSALPAAGIKLDMTPTRSSIVYVEPDRDPFGGTPVQAGEDPIGAKAGTPLPPRARAATLPGEKPSGPDDIPVEPGLPAPGTGAKGAGTGVGGAVRGAAQEAIGQLPETVQPYVIDAIKFGNTWGLTLNYKYNLEDQILNDLEGFEIEENHYRDKQEDDPYFKSKGSWGQGYDDQWAIKRAGFTDGKDSAWAAAGDDLAPVVVAVIDTGLDWNHADISWDNIWQNEDEIPENGIDDDGNGYVDDVIGWDFYTNSSIPWDQDGHGTFIAGMIAAASDNGTGIRGINPAAKIMVLKALNDFGHTRASYLAKAIKYAADNGARVINLSVGGGSLTKLERLAVEYAHALGAVIVVAAGNYGMETANYGLSPYPEVITVTSSDVTDKRTVFSNWGPEVDVAAPGVDVLSLRARRTDLMRHILAVEYEPGTAYVGEDRRYYRASGTSFSAPIVAGLASLILSKNPQLTNVEVKRMILHSARDIEVPGHDQYTGYGLVDAAAALTADPAFEITAGISGIEVVQQDGQTFVAVSGTADADQFAKAEVSIGAGEQPASFQPAGVVATPVSDGILAVIPAEAFRAAPVWTIRLVVTHENGKTREQWYTLTLG